MRNNALSIWTDDKTEALKSMWADGCSGGEIADSFGITRNAVCGKIHRLGLPLRQTHNGRWYKKTSEEIEAAKRRKNGRRKERRHAMQATITKPIGRPRPTVCEEVVPRHLILAELEPHHCRWPYGTGPYTFCGLDQYEGSSYCLGHLLANVRKPHND